MLASDSLSDFRLSFKKIIYFPEKLIYKYGAEKFSIQFAFLLFFIFLFSTLFCRRLNLN